MPGGVDMEHLTSGLKVDFLGVIPSLPEILSSEGIIAFSALLTFKGRTIKKLYQETLEKEQNPREKIRKILSKSSLRGHASIATTPTVALSFSGSKFPDSLLTGIIFSSGLMASGRRTKTEVSDIVFPDAIYKSPSLRGLYADQAKANIDFLNLMLETGIPQDEASKIMPYGILGTGIMVLPVESLVGLRREYEEENDWMPNEAKIIISEFEKKLPEFGLENLYYMRLVAPRDVYPYPNIFKNPKKENLARFYSQELKINQHSAIVDFRGKVPQDLAKRLKKLKDEAEKLYQSKRKIKGEWPEILKFRRQICRDYNLSIEVLLASRPSWRVWGEKKRHRTVPQIVDSIYYAVGEASDIFEKNLAKIKDEKLGDELLLKIDRHFSIPPTIRSKPEVLGKYLKIAASSFLTYQKLVKNGAKPCEAISIIPRGVRISVLQSYNLYNLISGYFPLRLCTTAEEQLRGMTEKEAVLLKKFLVSQKLKTLADQIIPKCHLVGFCPEEKFCGKIKAAVPFYEEAFHEEMKEELERRFLKIKDQI